MPRARRATSRSISSAAARSRSPIALLVAPAIFFFLNRIDGHVRFLPLIAGIVFLYAAGKALHLSPLVLVLGCGLLLNNPHLANWSRRLAAWRGDNYDQTLKEFKGLVAELTFATKSFFFLLLGYWTNVEKMASWTAWAVAATVFVVVFASRGVILRLLRQPDAAALTWIAPRGLITVLLFIAAADAGKLHEFSGGAVMLVVLATSAATALSRWPRDPWCFRSRPARSPSLPTERLSRVRRRSGHDGQERERREDHEVHDALQDRRASGAERDRADQQRQRQQHNFLPLKAQDQRPARHDEYRRDYGNGETDARERRAERKVEACLQLVGTRRARGGEALRQ